MLRRRRKRTSRPTPTVERTLADELRDLRMSIAQGETSAVEGLWDVLERVAKAAPPGRPPEVMDPDTAMERMGLATAYEHPKRLLEGGDDADAAHAVALLAERSRLLRRREGDGEESDPAQEKRAQRADDLWVSVLAWRAPEVESRIRAVWPD